MRDYIFRLFQVSPLIWPRKIARFALRSVLNLANEALVRASQVFCDPLDISLQQNLLLSTRDGPSSRFFFQAENRDSIIIALRNVAPEAESCIIFEADNVCRHVFDLLGSGPTHLGDKIDWHLDFKTGHRWNPRTFYKRISPASYPGGYDIKVPWELSRSQHFVRLGQAYWFTKDEKYAREFVAQVEDWIKSNPWPWGVNWACTMDVAIRVVNWLWGYMFFRDSISLSDEFCLTFFMSLRLHGRHIVSNLEGSNDNCHTTNHYISNLVGLVYLGICCPFFDEADRWLDVGSIELWNELFKQVNSDGTNYEGSIPYHRLVLEMYLSAILLCQYNNIVVPHAVLKRVEKMVEFVIDVTKPDGTVPTIGDQDNGRLLRLGTWEQPEREWIDYRYLMAIGAVLFERNDFGLAAGDRWDEALWLCSLERLKIIKPVVAGQNDCTVQASPLTVKDYPLGGFLIAKSRDTYLLARGGGIGTNGLGNHTHNDALSFEWYVGGRTLIRDSGAGMYTGDYKMRYIQRSVRSHSTICIDGRELCSLSVRRPFSLRGSRRINGGFQTTSVLWPIVCELAMEECTGLPPGLILRRKMELGQDGRHLLITDHIEGMGNHMVERFFVVGSVSSLEICGSVVIFQFDGGRLEIESTCMASAQTKIEETPISDYFGKSSRGNILRYSSELVLPSIVETHLWWISN